MRIDELEQEDSDIDWFAVDSDGHVLHVSSGGGVLPESVAASEETLLQLYQYFLALPDTASAALVQVEANAEKSGRNYQNAIRYAQRGLFSFDKTLLNKHPDPQYHLVVRPADPLTIKDIPEPIATLLLRTRLPEPVAAKTKLLVADIA
ncbi:hypothetical protein [Hymenobacter crusticola]|uniref:Uncharacterized protein n=1 Tax=Hymenobacter crusticola TaxID=1770526 RepID=A0A243WI62_9BACT|nr:hypothetical protein [Hymenobacter crusticola]OUJ75507.1 hypothetical protein BXP70_05730 [Hymenobacter crusticola]